MTARDLDLVTTWEQMDLAAAAAERVRVRGVVLDCGYGCSGSYRNRWLHIRTSAGLVRVTASVGSPLGKAARGTAVEIVASLTGLVDLTQGLYYAERAQVLSLQAA